MIATAGKPASFQLGSGAADAPKGEAPAVKVALARPYRIARYEVTQELYSLVMNTAPSRARISGASAP